jgi:hypothetical protein
MYIRTGEGLKQAPMGYGSIAGMVGEDVAKKKILGDYLNKVRKHPQNYKKLLLIANFHSYPTMSWFIKFFNVDRAKGLDFSDLLSKDSLPREQVDRELTRISEEFRKKDPGFDSQVKDELKHLSELWVTTGNFLNSINGRPFLIDAALLPALLKNFSGLGLEFARKALPRKLFQWINHSEASEAHGFKLFEYLKNYAEDLKKREPAFKAEVEQARKASDRVWAELIKRSGKQVSKCEPFFVDNFNPGQAELNEEIKKRTEKIADLISTELKLGQLNGKMGVVRPFLHFKGFVDKATDPKKVGLDLERAEKVGSSLVKMLKAKDSDLPIGISFDTYLSSSKSGGGPQPKTRNSQPSENRRVEVCLRGIEASIRVF